MIKQINQQAPQAFIWKGYRAIRTAATRFGGNQYQIRTKEDTYTFYARRDAAGKIEVMTGMRQTANQIWTPAGYVKNYRFEATWAPAENVEIDDAILYTQGTEHGPLDVFSLIEG